MKERQREVKTELSEGQSDGKTGSETDKFEVH
jgi:hypothetical protein